ncbi:SMP-30/gluconolactonase/LRE family protein [Saccharothrix coeruleofusca]|uniref:SMP-30/gluconolactonase/LRE family protein n=1 Tax=Saccharothrix coeruleofusca TaxID=33919 RepID=UPI00278C01ED|nr:SMP-30/gluconolactonase/LRE family protein [Saccharothrix coeruleofusca]MBP2333992.1 sugar lactone lactonase YvrE [Saccharothrix coeruleofusca]
MSIDVAVRAQAELGEDPTWDHSSATLLWVDVLASEVHRYAPARDDDAVLVVPQHVGAAKPRSRGGLVLNLRDGVALVEPDGAKTWLVYWARDGVRGNDAAVDPAGRLWAGTSRYDQADGGGWLARVEPNGDAKVVLDRVAVSNGLGWSPDGSLMYYVDSAQGRVDVLDYDRDSGQAVNRRPLCEVDRGVPDGLCVDADGCVWVALWGGGAVRRYTPAGELDLEVELPVDQPTACCFGGEDFTDLYVTTARTGLSEAALAERPLSGSVLVLPGVGSGMPSTAFAG